MLFWSTSTNQSTGHYFSNKNNSFQMYYIDDEGD